MTVPYISDEIEFQGPIALECALFCLDCEVIFTSVARCPSCGGAAVWPLARWLSLAQPGLADEAPPADCRSASDPSAAESMAAA
jgi:hypothetical protein